MDVSANSLKPAIYMPGPTADQVDRASDHFEEAADMGDLNKMDKIADAMARRTSNDNSRMGRRRARMERTLDRMASPDANGPELSKQDRETIHRLRTGLMANQNKYDGLKGPLGEKSAKQVMNDASALADKLRSQGRHYLANTVEKAANEMGKQVQGSDVPEDPMDKLADDFDQASAAGDGAKMDEIVDKLAKDADIDSIRDLGLNQTQKGLDKLGETARKFESMFEGIGLDKAADKFDKHNDTIQRMRKAIVAAMDGDKVRNGKLGGEDLGDLLKDAKDLKKDMMRGPFKKMAGPVKSAIRQLESLQNGSSNNWMSVLENLFSPRASNGY